ncbi:MAG: magnesium/cobalt transporter CorA [Sphaerochaetaceae bacterium]|nr:magnesium/cobalt transporter CorA [Sphaerochaetaceae bacterium]
MARFLKNRSAAQGKSPGSLVFIGKQKTDAVSIRLIQYHEQFFEDIRVSSVKELRERRREGTVGWIDINGLHDTELIAQVGEAFDIHPLTLEDIVNTGQRPKAEEFEHYISIMIKMMRLEHKDGRIHSEQLSIIQGSDFLITFQEKPGDVFEPVRERLRSVKGRHRKSGTDYLAYTLLDTIVDNYMILIERLGEQIEAMEPQIIDSPGPELLNTINENRRELHFLRTSVRPGRDALRELSRLQTDLIGSSVSFFLRDLNDLATQAVEAMDTYREMLKDQLESHGASSANRLNETMKFLTVFSVVFIPLSLLAGIYGTNFTHMPELQFRYAYPIFWGVLIVVAGCMVWIFKRKKWL